MDHVLLSLYETVSPRRGEALRDHQREGGVGIHAHIATLDVWADARRHVTLEGLREMGKGGQTTEEPWKEAGGGREGGRNFNPKYVHILNFPSMFAFYFGNTRPYCENQ